LNRCLTVDDDTMPTEVKVGGALILVYGVPISRIHNLTTDRITTSSGQCHITFDAHPVLLPPNLAQLIKRPIALSTPRRHHPPIDTGRRPHLPLPRATANAAYESQGARRPAGRTRHSIVDRLRLNTAVVGVTRLGHDRVGCSRRPPNANAKSSPSSLPDCPTTR
jgi:hypothetical protein